MRANCQNLLKVAFVTAFLIVPAVISAASLYISPESGTYSAGDTFPLRLRVTSTESINAISAELRFDSTVFVVDSVSKNSSMLNFWVTEPTFSNAQGKVNLEGVVLGGFGGGSGTVINLNMRALKPGTGRVDITSGQVLANDGQGTDVTKGLTGGSYTISEAKTPKPVSTPTVETPIPEPVIAPILNAPEIVLVNKYGEKAISGTSNYPKAEVVMTFVNEVGVKVFILGSTDESGSFLLLVPKTLKRGIYKISAQVVQRDSGHSASSNEIEITIGNIISDMGLEARVAFILLLLTVAYLLYRVHSYFSKMKKVHYEVSEVKDVVKKSFKILEEDMRESMEREKNSENKSKMKEVMSDIEEAETLIIKEVKDVEKL